MKTRRQGIGTALVAAGVGAGFLVLGAAAVLEPGAILRAQTAEWQLVASNAVPRFASFHSMQFPKWPPLPLNRFPELAVYWSSNAPLGYWVDDRGVDYEALWAQQELDRALSSLEREYGLDDSGGPPQVDPMSSFAEGSLWLSISQFTNGIAPLTIHGTAPEVLYEIQSEPTLPDGPWGSEGGVVGAANQDWTAAAVAVGGRTNSLFFRVRSLGSGDGYGVPWEWYVAQGLDPLAPDIGGEDANGDGLANWQEYMRGGDPQLAGGFGVWVSSPSGGSGIP